jgi:hypothetical protein
MLPVFNLSRSLRPHLVKISSFCGCAASAASLKDAVDERFPSKTSVGGFSRLSAPGAALSHLVLRRGKAFVT